MRKTLLAVFAYFAFTNLGCGGPVQALPENLVGCNLNTDCPTGFTCGTDHACHGPGGNCGNVNCPAGWVCTDPATSTCQQFTCGNVNCPSGWFCANPSTSTCQQNNCGPVNCPSGQTCVNSTNGTCSGGGNGGPTSQCTLDSQCQAGLTCVIGFCQAPLCITSNQNASAFKCSPYPANASTNPTVTPILTTVTAFFNGTNQSTQMFCCPHNGAYGSVWTDSASPPVGCSFIGKGFNNNLVACQPIQGQTAPISGGQR